MEPVQTFFMFHSVARREVGGGGGGGRGKVQTFNFNFYAKRKGEGRCIAARCLHLHHSLLGKTSCILRTSLHLHFLCAEPHCFHTTYFSRLSSALLDHF